MTLHHGKRTHKQQQIFWVTKIFIFWKKFLGGPQFRTGLQSQDEFKWTSQSRAECEKMILDPVEWFLGAHNGAK